MTKKNCARRTNYTLNDGAKLLACFLCKGEVRPYRKNLATRDVYTKLYAPPIPTTEVQDYTGAQVEKVRASTKSSHARSKTKATQHVRL